MKNFFGFFGIIIFLVFISFAIFSIFPKEEGKKISIISPVPDFLSIVNNKQVSNITLWLPILENFISSGVDKPEVSAKSALVLDLDSKKVLYEKNSKQKLPMASLTKIMTAVIALENPKKNNKYLASQKDLVAEDS